MDQELRIFDPDKLPNELLFAEEVPGRRLAYDKLKDLVIRKMRERPTGTVHFLQCPGERYPGFNPIREGDQRITLILEDPK